MTNDNMNSSQLVTTSSIPYHRTTSTTTSTSNTKSGKKVVKRGRHPLPRKEEEPNKKRSNEMTDEEVNEIVDMLGIILVKVKKEISDKKDIYEPSAAVTFLLRRMDVENTPEDIYCLMTGFMTVYVSFIQEVFLHKFKEFMRLFSSHDSLLGGHDIEQPFLWLYLSYDKTNNLSILNDLHKQLLPKRYDPNYILSRIDAIFTKFYTTHFLEAHVQQHQKDHGQFYTPQPIISFMWDQCTTLPSLTQHLKDNLPMLRIFDPCLGMGSFLCEFLTRFIKACKFTCWNDPVKLTTLLARDIPNNIWGVEIDPFAYQLSKINMMVHLFPLYERLKELKVDLVPGMINRLRLFCNDSLQLHHDSNPFIMSSPTIEMDPFEKACLNVLRNASQKFDFIVTNPPYMIRKTGFISQPDPIVYNEEKLGGRGSQAYLYFMWIALQRCDDTSGQVCLITPSQWTILEFAQHLREWIWENCKLLNMYEFEPYKVWPRVQTDSLIFRMCKRTATLQNATQTIYLRSTSRKATLLELLEQYRRFDPAQPSLDKDVKYKINSLQNPYRKLVSKHASFSFVLPTASCLDELNDLTAHHPRLCDGENSKASAGDKPTPLNWNRGPNTNPVYSLVVRTKWAKDTFGEIACERYLKPCFYWNGKTITSSSGGGKEGEFWKERDPLRLGKKEMSAAEAYWPYCNLDLNDPTMSFYSLIMVNKEDASQLEKEIKENGSYSPMAALYDYLREARDALQGDKKDKTIAHCQYNRCGTEVPVKIIHPINCGYYTKSQPRQRFFVDYTRAAVTNQCIYFTIKPDHPCQNADYYCGLLNSVLLQFFAKVNCCYDQQGRMRFFGRLMANIPFAPPPKDYFMDHIATFTQGMTEARTWIYSFVRYTPNGHRLMERVRNCEWHLHPTEVTIAHQFSPPSDWTLQPDTSLSKFTCPPQLNWIAEIVTKESLTNPETIEHVLITLLKISSLFQYAVDQIVYYIYKIPPQLQMEVEEDLNLLSFRKEWEGYENLDFDREDPIAWFQQIMDLAKSFTTVRNLNIVLASAPSPLAADDTIAQDTITSDIIAQDSITPDIIAQDIIAQEIITPDTILPDIEMETPTVETPVITTTPREAGLIPAEDTLNQPFIATATIPPIPTMNTQSTITTTTTSSTSTALHTKTSIQNLIHTTTPVNRAPRMPFSIQQAISMMNTSKSMYDEDDEDVDITTVASDIEMYSDDDDEDENSMK